MRHRKGGRKLNMNQSHRKATFRNMVTSLMLHGSIRTTQARAKELRRYAERVITIAKKAPSASAIDGMSGDEAVAAKAQRVHAIRRAKRWVLDPAAIERLFDEYAPRFEARAGGYTRIIKADIRTGDNAEMAIIEFVGESERAEVSGPSDVDVDALAASAAAAVETAVGTDDAAPAEGEGAEE